MKLVRARVTNFRSIYDSGTVEVDPDVTVLVGQNEAGKTAFLRALYKARPVEKGAGYHIEDDYPRSKNMIAYKKEHEKNPAPVAELTYELTDAEQTAIAKEMGADILRSRRFTVTHKYGETMQITLDTVEEPLLTALAAGAGLSTEVSALVRGAGGSITRATAALGGATLNETEQGFLAALQTRFAKTPQGWVPSQWELWSKFLQPRTPKFLYFDEYQVLPDKVNLAALLSRKQQVDSGQRASLDDGDGTVLGLLRVAGLDLEQLVGQGGYEDLKATLESFSNSVTDRVFQYWTQNRDLEAEVDIRSDPSAEAPFNNGPNLYVRIKNRRHRATVSFAQRSKGFIWFFSFLVWFDSVKDQLDTTGDVILLLDEPGLSLHALGQKDYLKYIDDLAGRHQVLYTTHSPFMVHSDRLDQVRVVEDMHEDGTKISGNLAGSDPKTLFPLQAALGYTVAQNLFISSRNLLVEGPGDLVYLKAMSAAVEASGADGMRDDITIVPVGGLDNVATFIALLGANDLELAVLHDSAGKPHQRLEALKREKLVRGKLILEYGQFRSNGAKPSAKGKAAKQAAAAAPPTAGLPPATDVEDLFTPATYLRLFNGAFVNMLKGTQLAEGDLPAGDRIVDRIGRALDAKGIRLRPSGGFNHYTVASYFASSGQVPDSATLERFAAIFKAVNGVFTARAG